MQMQMQVRMFMAAAALAVLTAVPGRASESIPWQTSYTAAKAAAKKSHKLILVDFYADW